MSETNQVQESTSEKLNKKQELNMHEVLRNALDWKQWLADDLRLLIQAKKDATADDSVIHAFVVQHLGTYELLNRVFGMVMGDSNEEIFTMPEISVLQQAVPDLGDESEPEQNHDVEPMLELQLNQLGHDLSDTLNHPVKQGGSENDSTAISDEYGDPMVEDALESSQNESVETPIENPLIEELALSDIPSDEQYVAEITTSIPVASRTEPNNDQNVDSIIDDVRQERVDETISEKEPVTTDSIISRVWGKSFEDDFFNSKGVTEKHDDENDNGGIDGYEARTDEPENE